MRGEKEGVIQAMDVWEKRSFIKLRGGENEVKRAGGVVKMGS